MGVCYSPIVQLDEWCMTDDENFKNQLTNLVTIIITTKDKKIRKNSSKVIRSTISTARFTINEDDSSEMVSTKKLANALNRCVDKRLSDEKKDFLPKLKECTYP